MANNTYLDEDGLSYLWGKISAALNLKANLKTPTFTGTPKAPTAAAGTNTTQIATTAFVKTAIDNVELPDEMTLLDGVTGTSTDAMSISPSVLQGVIGYLGGEYTGMCYTNADVAAKVVGTDASFDLNEGVSVIVNFVNSNTASNCTLNVNGTGAYPVNYNGSTYTGSSTIVCGYAGRLVKYKFYADEWVWMGSSYDSNTTYSAMSQTEADTGTATTGRTITAKVLNDTIGTNFGKVKFGSTTASASKKSDVLTLTEGSNVTLTLDDENNTLGIATAFPEMTQADATAGTSEVYQLINPKVLQTTIQNAVSSASTQALKSCVIGQPNTLSTDNWFKVTEITITNTAADRDLIFLVSALYPGSGEDYGRKSGILRLHVRTGSTAMSATSPQNNLTWLSNTGFDPSDFAIAFNTDSLPATVQLWVKIEKVYQRYSFTLLKESSRTGMISSTVLNSTTTGSAAPTSGYTIVYSTNEYSTDHLYLAECDTAAATAAKVVTVDDVRFALTKGVEIYVKFTNSNSASNVTLNVNGTGALPIWYGASEYAGASTTVCGYAERYLKYVYNGTHWVWAGHSTDLNTTYSAMSQTEADTGTATTGRTITAKVLDTKIKNVLDSYYQYESAPYTYSLAAGAVYSGTVSSAVANPIFALAGFNSGNNNVVFTNIRKYDSDGDIHYTIRNVGTSAVSNATLYISFITKAS